MTAASIITEAFGEEALEDLYLIVLGVSADATLPQLKKAYHKLALKHHPDKVASNNAEEISAAKLKFQAISVTYQILSDEERRKEYDQSGELVDIDDGFVSSNSFTQWDQFFKSLFPGINFDDIDRFTVKYRESDEEQLDVLKYYNVCKGDLNKMVNCVMCSEKADKRRWVKNYIDPAIRRGDVPRFEEALAKTMGSDDEDDDDYDDIVELGNENVLNNKKRSTKKASSSKTSPTKNGPTATKAKKKSKMSKEAEEKMAEALISQIRGKNKNGSVLTKRAEAFDSLISQMENKYSTGNNNKKKNSTTKSTIPAEIPDDEFELIQAKLDANRTSKGNSKRRN